jgi:hypothetical protein
VKLWMRSQDNSSAVEVVIFITLENHSFPDIRTLYLMHILVYLFITTYITSCIYNLRESRQTPIFNRFQHQLINFWLINLFRSSSAGYHSFCCIKSLKLGKTEISSASLFPSVFNCSWCSLFYQLKKEPMAIEVKTKLVHLKMDN